MLFLLAPCELTRENKDLLRNLIQEKTGEDCIVLDSGMQIVQIPVKKDSATGGDQ